MTRYPMVLLLAAFLAAPLALEAQSAATSELETELREMVTAPDAAEMDRRTVEDFLSRDDVADVADAHGIDVERLRDGARTLGADAAADLSQRIRTFQDDGDLVGGNTIVISTTTIIIALLVLILIAVI